MDGRTTARVRRHHRAHDRGVLTGAPAASDVRVRDPVKGKTLGAQSTNLARNLECGPTPTAWSRRRERDRRDPPARGGAPGDAHRRAGPGRPVRLPRSRPRRARRFRPEFRSQGRDADVRARCAFSLLFQPRNGRARGRGLRARCSAAAPGGAPDGGTVMRRSADRGRMLSPRSAAAARRRRCRPRWARSASAGEVAAARSLETRPMRDARVRCLARRWALSTSRAPSRSKPGGRDAALRARRASQAGATAGDRFRSPGDRLRALRILGLDRHPSPRDHCVERLRPPDRECAARAGGGAGLLDRDAPRPGPARSDQLDRQACGDADRVRTPRRRR